ncbi:MAG: peptidase M23 [Cellulomonas sp. 73-92]|uniref:M23 family metallopeptidase n=1 Tax=Cellulomonas sp. 73-92 TaxID=1895740 RepID=UPI000928D9E0|nr:M23 family metallopeptidase [Cellulomonas sp. 73-92]OJV75951.1 MAG: peptidase M23 [Cellulomonas sp. 73-92]
MKKTLLVGLVLIMFAPLVGLLGAATLANPALTAQGACLTPGLGVLAVPDALQVTTGTGATISLDHQQLTHAATIIDTGARTPGVGYDGILVALMAALTESRLRQLANTSAYPDSATYPNDGDGADHDSLGLFQMRPAAGWGTVAQLMDPGYQARAFYGGPAGPNAGSPRGLLDIPGWQQLTPGQAAQAVEVSAFPDRYQTYQPAATSILATLTTAPGPSPTSSESPMPETGSLVFPLPAGTYVRTSGYGMRDDPLTGQRRLHAGVDWAAPAGTPILALADGLVLQAGLTQDGTGRIVLEHTIDAQPVASVYLHMTTNGIHVHAGDHVIAGQHIGDVGSTGHSTGPHLHFEIHPGGPDTSAIDPEPWLADHDLQHLTTPTAGGPRCTA